MMAGGHDGINHRQITQRSSVMKKLLLATAAFIISGSPAFASNYINLDATAASTGVSSLTINQDATHATNSITGDGTQGTTLNLRGTWTGVTINQYGGND